MEMIVNFPGGKKVDATFNGFTFRTDQAVHSGGDASAPQPFDMFLASIATCAGIYVKSFCDTRGIDTSTLEVRLRIVPDRKRGRIGTLGIDILLPEGFPEKWKKAVIRSADLCAVKQHMLEPPKFEVQAFLPGERK
jgi:putative redox protein